MTVEIKSRKEIERMALEVFADNTALISITDYGYPFAKLKYRPKFLLQVAFYDVPIADDFGEELGHEPDADEKKIIEKAARERLGFHYPEEQVFKDVSGSY